MTSGNGEESPTPLGDEPEAINSQPVVCISPVVESQLVDASAGVLCPIVAEDSVPMPAEEPKVDGETFEQRMARHGVAETSLAWRALYLDFHAEVRRLAEIAAATAEEGEEVEAEGDERADEDGAIVFEGVQAEWREARLPADVPVPSRETIRRHRAAGHCP